MSVEVFRPHVISKHDIIVEVDEILGQSWNAMQVTFYGWGTVGGQVRLIDKDVLQTVAYACRVTLGKGTVKERDESSEVLS